MIKKYNEFIVERKVYSNDVEYEQVFKPHNISEIDKHVLNKLKFKLDNFQNHIIEKRSYSKNNIDKTFNEFITILLEKTPIKNIFISFRDTINVNDVNPSNYYTTPTGVYCYSLESYFKNKEELINITEEEFRRKFTFESERKYIYFIILKSFDNIIDEKTPKDVINNYIKKIQLYYTDVDYINKKCIMFLNNKYKGKNHKLKTINFIDNISISLLFLLFLYDISNYIVKDKSYKRHNKILNRINIICRKIGLDGFIDYENSGYIRSEMDAGRKLYEAVFFKLKNISDVYIYEKPKESYEFLNKNGYFNNKNYKCVKKNGKYNFINKNNKIINKNWFDSIWEYKIPMVKLNNKYNFIDDNGYLLSKIWFDDVHFGGFKNGFVGVSKNNKWNYLNENGDLLSEIWFDNINDINNFQNGISNDIE